MKLAANPVVFLLRPDARRAHALESLRGSFHRAREHEAHGLKQGDRGGVELLVLAADRGFADVAGDQMDALDLRDGDLERLGDRRFDQAFAEADAHLAGNDLDEEAGRFRLQAAQDPFQRRLFRFAARGADRLQRRFDVLQGNRLGLRATIERLTCPVAKIRMLAEEPAELVLVASGDRRHRLADRRPAKPQRPPLRRAERAAAHEDGRAAQVVIVEPFSRVADVAPTAEPALANSSISAWRRRRGSAVLRRPCGPSALLRPALLAYASPDARAAMLGRA